MKGIWLTIALLLIGCSQTDPIGAISRQQQEIAHAIRQEAIDIQRNSQRVVQAVQNGIKDVSKEVKETETILNNHRETLHTERKKYSQYWDTLTHAYNKRRKEQ